MSVRRVTATVLFLAAVLLAGFALVRAVDNPDVAWSGEGDYQCSAPWDTALNGADNVPGGEPPLDAQVVATRCRTAGFARFDQAYVAGVGSLGVLAVAATLGWGGSPRTRRRLTARAVVGVVAVASVAGLGWAGWERDHPTAFVDNGASVGMDPLPAGKTLYFGVTWPGNPDHDVVLESAHPRVTTDSAASDVEVVACVAGGLEGTPIGTAFDSHLDRYCSKVLPIWPDEPDVRLSSARHDQLLIRVTPRRPGRVEIAGVDVVYRDGWQQGHQKVTARVGATTPTTPAKP